jgi:hypothetical protein
VLKKELERWGCQVGIGEIVGKDCSINALGPFRSCNSGKKNWGKVYLKSTS